MSEPEHVDPNQLRPGPIRNESLLPELLDQIEAVYDAIGPYLHDAVWRTMAEKLGCQPDRLKTNIVLQPSRYKAVCPTCQRVFYKYRRPKYIQGYDCSECGKEHGRLKFLDQRSNRETRKSAAL